MTYGVILQPRFAPKLAVSIDYFDIDIQDTVSTYGPSNTLTACYANNDPAACARIHRTPDGPLWVGDGHVEDRNINIGSLQTSGYDLSLNYARNRDGPLRRAEHQRDGHLLDELVTDPGAGIEPYDCVGLSRTIAWRRRRSFAATRAWAGSRPGTWTSR